MVFGEAGVNESLLTGEADEVSKAEGDELMSGSFVVAGSLLARIVRVGQDSYASQLTAQAKAVKDHPSEMVADIERIVLVAGILVIPVGGLLFWQSASGGQTYPEAIISMVGAVTGMIPEGLYLLVTIALALSAMRLAKKQVLLHNMRSIEELARTDVLCVDKTGTITCEDMSINELFGTSGASSQDLAAARDLLACYIHTVSDTNATMQALRAYLPDAPALSATEVTPFSSKLKYSEVTTGTQTLRLGAPEFLLEAATLATCAPLIDARTCKGLRVLAFVDASGRDATPLLFVSLSNEVRENAVETFAEFEREGVEVLVISGDNPQTVSRVAQEAGIKGSEHFVDASTLDTPEKIAASIGSYTVYGRVKPEQKSLIVKALQATGKKVAMTGDGVNDILAMKAADCSIAMGAGSDAARQAAQVVLLDSDFSRMHAIVSEGRRDINNITRSATLFLYKNIFSLALALFSIFGAFAYPLTPNQVSLISLFNIGIPALLLTFEPNEAKQAGRFIDVVLRRALPAALTSFVAIAYMMVFADLFGVSEADVSTASTYLLSTVGFLILINLIQPPTRYRLIVFAVSLLGLVVCCSVLWELFDISALSYTAVALCIVFALAEVGVMQILTTANDWAYTQLFRRKMALAAAQ